MKKETLKEGSKYPLVELLELLEEAQKEIEEREREGIIHESHVVYLRDGTKVHL